MYIKKIKLDKILKKNSYSIILFHGVIKKNKTKVRNYTNKHLELSKFTSIIKFLKSKGNCLSVKEFIKIKKEKKKLPDYSFSVSFDDGFENNYKLAAPVLNKFRIPTIFYVTTNLLKNNQMTWIDQIEILLENNNFIKNKFLSKKKIILDTKTSKINFLKFLRKKVKSNYKKYNTEKIVREIYKQANKKVINSSNNQLDKKMSFSQLKKLSKNPLFSIGGHCHNHVSMTSLNKKKLSYEIDTCLKILQNELKFKIDNFSYPEGSRIDYNKSVINALKKRGIICCPTAVSGYNNKKTDLFELKRFMI